MKRNTILFLTYCLLFFCQLSVAQTLRAPAYPLITHDPYFSIWSMTDTLNAAPTRHWTGSDQALLGMVKVDGIVYRFLGAEEQGFKTILPASDEKAYDVK